MPGLVRTHFLPQMVQSGMLAGAVAVVIDQLRASTTICAALGAGARMVIPCADEEEARRLKRADPSVLMGGEREGVLIEGFDLDNSPASYTGERVGGKAIAFTTTNGTKAAILAREAGMLVVGCLANLSALAECLAQDDRDVHLIGAGTRTRMTLEDVLTAGAIASALAAHGRALQLADARPDDDSTTMAVRLWEDAQARPGGVAGALRASRGGRNLAREGLAADIDLCAKIDAYPVVPVFDRRSGAFVRG